MAAAPHLPAQVYHYELVQDVTEPNLSGPRWGGDFRDDPSFDSLFTTRVRVNVSYDTGTGTFSFDRLALEYDSYSTSGSGPTMRQPNGTSYYFRDINIDLAAGSVAATDLIQAQVPVQTPLGDPSWQPVSTWPSHEVVVFSESWGGKNHELAGEAVLDYEIESPGGTESGQVSGTVSGEWEAISVYLTLLSDDLEKGLFLEGDFFSAIGFLGTFLGPTLPFPRWHGSEEDPEEFVIVFDWRQPVQLLREDGRDHLPGLHPENPYISGYYFDRVTVIPEASTFGLLALAGGALLLPALRRRS